MLTILSQIKDLLAQASGENIFTAYDAIPIREKGKYFTILSVSGYEAMNPIYTETSIYMPVKCNMEITVAAPVNTTYEQIYDYFYGNFDSVLDSICGISNRLKAVEIAPDSKLGRLTLKAVMKISAMKILPR